MSEPTGGGREQPRFETLAIHAGQDPDPRTGAVVPAIHLATTYAQDEVGAHRGFEYSRTGNPTRAVLETVLATLERASFGFAFASGMAAEDALLRLLRPRDHLVIPNDAYGGTYRLVARVHSEHGVEFTAADPTDPARLAEAMRPTTRMVWVESPSNPTLRIADLAALAEVAHAGGALLVVDNTFATPYLQQPLELGADVVVHSTTKYLGGHSDVVGGFVATSDEEVAARVGFLQNSAGAVPSPFDCYLVLRGVKTLAVRLDRQCRSASAVAAFLTGHPAVDAVFYPGLEAHPGHEIATRQMRDYGAMVSFTLRAGEAAALEVAASTGVFTLAESLGAVESLIEHPARMTHLSVAGSELAVDPSLLRLSIGLEAVEDLTADLGHALDRALP
ncbi:MAG TPA: cystathionine gamma-synthase [Acidimicrobiales bacterium]|nr:cystathionine gamma-synthase [Acidimicrobiales bacterium]